MPSELLLLYFGLLQCLPHTVSVVPTSIVVEGPGSVTVSEVATTVGALAASIRASITSIQLSQASSAVSAFTSVTVSAIVANKDGALVIYAASTVQVLRHNVALQRSYYFSMC